MPSPHIHFSVGQPLCVHGGDLRSLMLMMLLLVYQHTPPKQTPSHISIILGSEVLKVILGSEVVEGHRGDPGGLGTGYQGHEGDLLSLSTATQPHPLKGPFKP